MTRNKLIAALAILVAVTAAATLATTGGATTRGAKVKGAQYVAYYDPYDNEGSDGEFKVANLSGIDIALSSFCRDAAGDIIAACTSTFTVPAFGIHVISVSGLATGPIYGGIIGPKSILMNVLAVWEGKDKNNLFSDHRIDTSRLRKGL